MVDAIRSSSGKCGRIAYIFELWKPEHWWQCDNNNNNHVTLTRISAPLFNLVVVDNGFFLSNNKVEIKHKPTYLSVYLSFIRSVINGGQTDRSFWMRQSIAYRSNTKKSFPLEYDCVCVCDVIISLCLNCVGGIKFIWVFSWLMTIYTYTNITLLIIKSWSYTKFWMNKKIT